MNIPCPVRINCPGNSPVTGFDTPLANLSSELPDNYEYIGISWGWDWNIPNLGTTWDNPWQIGTCLNPTSQVFADLCAMQNQINNTNHGIHPPNNPVTGTTPVFVNSAQICPITCSDGTVSTFTFPAGLVSASTQLMADRIAQSLACRYAVTNFICMGSLDRYVCLNQPYRSSFTADSTHPPLNFDVVAGDLPPGLSPKIGTDRKTFILEGIPTTAGAYPFTLRCTDSNGIFLDKNYEIDVLGVTNMNPLPSATEHTFYSVQLTAAGNVGPVTFTLLSGTLPGMTLSSSGLISGTPDYLTAGDYGFEISIVDSVSGLACVQDGTLHIGLRPGPDWTQLVWSAYPLHSIPPISHCTGTALKNIATASLDKDGTEPNNGYFPNIRGAAAAGVTYSGGAVTSRIRITVSAGSGFNDHLCRLFRNGIGIGGSTFTNVTPGVYEFNIAIPASVNAVFTIDDGSPGNSWAECVNLGTAESLVFTWGIFNV